MSEFTSKLRTLDYHMNHESVRFADLRYHDGFTADLLDALDARVRALEAKFVTTGGEIVGDYFVAHHPLDPAEPPPKFTSVDNLLKSAVLAERERCAKVAETMYAGDSRRQSNNATGDKIAAVIRRG